MHIAIIGGGSTGLLLATYFATENKVTIYVRSPLQAIKINKEGVTTIDGENTYKSFPEAYAITELKDCEADLLFICVKQVNIEAVLLEIDGLKQNLPIIFLQNGSAHIKQLENRSEEIYLGVLDHGAMRLDPITVAHTGKGAIRVARYLNAEQDTISNLELLDTMSFPIYIAYDWQKLIYEKLIINIVINPLTALFGIKNGGILTNTYFKLIAREICKEAADVLKLNIEENWEKVIQVILKTKHNYSSMHQDLNAGRKTEIEAILGGVMTPSTPYITMVYHSIKGLELNKGNVE